MTATIEVDPTWGALQYAQRLGGIVAVKQPHFWCKVCPESEAGYRLGGFSHAAQHFRKHHYGEQFDVRIEMRWPK